MIKHIHMDDIKEQVVKYHVVIVKFGADWCAPCYQMIPELEKVIRARPTVIVFDVDVDKSEDAWKQYNISGVPTCFCYKNGKRVGERLVGGHMMNDILEWIDGCLQDEN